MPTPLPDDEPLLSVTITEPVEPISVSAVAGMDPVVVLSED